jgi:DNA-directed RNA polymerase II subunit RPB1
MIKFDGDQMNLWVVRGPAARAEAAVMSPVANWFISTKTSGPVNGEVQDSTVGSYELTRTGVVLDKYHAMGLFAAAGEDPPRFDELPADHLYTGREAVSLLLQRAPVNYKRAPSSYNEVYAPFLAYDPDETLTEIKQGRLLRGVLDKKAIGAGATGGLFHRISRAYGPQRALDMVYAVQRVALQYLLWRGITVSAVDMLPSAEARAKIHELVSGVLLEARVSTDQLLRGELLPRIGETLHAFYEHQQRAALKAPEAEIMRWIITTTRPETNGFFHMVMSGSKGSPPNIIHMGAEIGQTLINGERIQEQFAFHRTLPYFPRFSTDPTAYGWVSNSYMSGMRAAEYLCQNMSGRFDLISKALTTASTGYFMRKGVMNNQSSLVDNSRRIMKDTKLVQILYGDDGLDARELEQVEFRTVLLGDTALREALWVDVAAVCPGAPVDAVRTAQAAVDAAYEFARDDRNEYRRIFSRIEASNFKQAFATTKPMPVHVERIVEGVFIARAPNHTAAPLTPQGLSGRVQRVNDLCARLPYTLLNEIQERRRSPVPAHMKAAASLLCMLVRAELGPRVLQRLSDEELDFVCESIRHRYSLSLVDYGTAAGMLAAQSISEPLTQYMLNSHHRSVAGGTNKAGLTRVAEIYGAKPVSEEKSSEMLLPLLREPLEAEGAGAPALAQKIAVMMEHVTLRDFVATADHLYEAYGSLVYPPTAEEDTAWISEFEKYLPLVRVPSDLTKWGYRFVLDQSALLLKSVEVELIVERLTKRHPGLYVVHTPGVVAAPVIRVWHRASQFRKGANEEDTSAALLGDVLDTQIRGIKGVLRAEAETITRMRAGPDGAYVKESRWVIRTTGTNLYMAMLNKYVDTTCAITTSVGDTCKMLGLMAGSEKIINETRGFMEDTTPNLRHLLLYSREMVRTGKVTSIERGGLGAREHNNVLLRMAYGDPISVLTDATLTCIKGRVYGIAAPQMLGSTPLIGTLYNGLVVDEDFVRENTKSVDSVLDEL